MAYREKSRQSAKGPSETKSNKVSRGRHGENGKTTGYRDQSRGMTGLDGSCDSAFALSYSATGPPSSGDLGGTGSADGMGENELDSAVVAAE